MSSKKTRSVTFRLTEDTVTALEYEAKKIQVSLNVLVNQVLGQFVSWQSQAPAAGFISFPKTTLVRIMDKLTEDEAKGIGKIHAEKDMEDILLMLRSELTVDTFLDAVETWMKDNKMIFRHDVKGDLHKYIIQHDLSKNWSWYISEFIRNTIEGLTSKKVETTVTDNTVAFSVDKSSIIEK